MTDSLPRGIWFDTPKNRWRIRLYRNGRAYLRYRRSREAALKAHADLKEELAKIPKLTRAQMRRGVIPRATFASMARAMQN